VQLSLRYAIVMDASQARTVAVGRRRVIFMEGLAPWLAPREVPARSAWRDDTNDGLAVVTKAHSLI
jgi:hypothetical protein